MKVWCNGCGNYLILHALEKIVKELNLTWRNAVIVCGIGCIGRIFQFLELPCVHTLHGRAIPVAEGIKYAKPGARVIVVGGDGDLLSIGLSHLVHAARRNIDITVLCSNNHVYAMTGGQPSPTTPLESTTVVGKNTSKPLNVEKLITSCDAYYVRTTVVSKHLKNVIKKAILHRGFAFVEILNICYTRYGKRNYNSINEMIKELKRMEVRK